MRQAIITKYLGPTNHRGARVKATAQAGSITLSWDDALDVEDNHTSAARALCKKFHWPFPPGSMVGGALPDDTGYAFVLVAT